MSVSTAEIGLCRSAEKIRGGVYSGDMILDATMQRPNCLHCNFMTLQSRNFHCLDLSIKEMRDRVGISSGSEFDVHFSGRYSRSTLWIIRVCNRVEGCLWHIWRRNLSFPSNGMNEKARLLPSRASLCSSAHTSAALANNNTCQARVKTAAHLVFDPAQSGPARIRRHRGCVHSRGECTGRANTHQRPLRSAGTLTAAIAARRLRTMNSDDLTRFGVRTACVAASSAEIRRVSSGTRSYLMHGTKRHRGLSSACRHKPSSPILGASACHSGAQPPRGRIRLGHAPSVASCNPSAPSTGAIHSAPAQICAGLKIGTIDRSTA